MNRQYAEAAQEKNRTLEEAFLKNISAYYSFSHAFKAKAE
jgi:hypothetical protein